MKVIILAGGFGTRLSEETELKPKPMVEIGGRPILWHIMKIYSAFGFNEFIIAGGYKVEVIKSYFLNFYALNNDITVDLSNGDVTFYGGDLPNWKVHIIDTGLYTQTGGRLKRLQNWINDGETFMFTYGDGVGNIDLKGLLRFHKSHGKLATVTTVKVPARFGRITFEKNRVKSFYEKPKSTQGWINGGFFVLEKGVFDFIEGDDTIWEREPVEALSKAGELMGYKHDGFWSCMDTLKEKRYLEELWNSGKAPWKVW